MEKEPIGENISPQKSIETSKIKSQICETVLNILKGGIKNRITALSYLGTGISIYSSDADNAYTALLFSSILTCSSMGLLWTGLGLGTEIAYKRSKNHISKYGKLDERFFIRIVDYYKNNYFIGYCEQQGIYLAAKEIGLEEEFFELKKKHTKNIVPNF